MKYGDKYEVDLVNRLTGEKFHSPVPVTYRYTSWGDWHTNNQGEGLWCGDHQILGNCQFDVCGCSTEKAAKAKIRRWVQSH